ncbi:MAG: hypothetical protein ACK5WP_09425 [Neisseriaceae bacterium]
MINLIINALGNNKPLISNEMLNNISDDVLAESLTNSEIIKFMDNLKIKDSIDFEIIKNNLVKRMVHLFANSVD